MDAIDAILSRRSIRKYSSEPVAENTVNELMQVAMSAPSAGNQQAWQFVVIDDRQILDEVPKFHSYAEMLKEAPVAIAVCGDLQLEKNIGFWVQDCSAATQNILVAAQAMGLGTVWLGVYPREERVQGLQKLLSLPEHVIPLCIIAVGHPAEEKPRANRYDASRVHHNRW
ncbi:nitroreductase family protein [Chloroflexota bacterium]